jgi:hypothetical protein
MNNPELLSKLNKSASRIARALRQFVEPDFWNQFLATTQVG